MMDHPFQSCCPPLHGSTHSRECLEHMMDSSAMSLYGIVVHDGAAACSPPRVSVQLCALLVYSVNGATNMHCSLCMHALPHTAVQTSHMQQTCMVCEFVSDRHKVFTSLCVEAGIEQNSNLHN